MRIKYHMYKIHNINMKVEYLRHKKMFNLYGGRMLSPKDRQLVSIYNKEYVSNSNNTWHSSMTK